VGSQRFHIRGVFVPLFHEKRENKLEKKKKLEKEFEHERNDKRKNK